MWSDVRRKDCGTREVVDVDYNCHLVRCYKKAYAGGRGGSFVPMQALSSKTLCF